MTLKPDRLARFARHIVLPEIGGAGQVALAGAHVVLIGVGGIGAPALEYLGAAGIGRLTLIDNDVIETSNLQRQVIFTPADVGRPKVDVAAEWLYRFDPAIECDSYVRRLTLANAREIVHGATVVLDGCDNFATRLAVSDACVAAGVPLVSAAIGRFQGQVASFRGHLPGKACYRCFVGDAFDAEDCDTCAEQGVLGAMTGMVASFAAMQAIRVCLGGAGMGDPEWGVLHLIDGLKPEIRKLRIAKDPKCHGCAQPELPLADPELA